MDNDSDEDSDAEIFSILPASQTKLRGIAADWTAEDKGSEELLNCCKNAAEILSKRQEPEGQDCNSGYTSLQDAVGEEISGLIDGIEVRRDKARSAKRRKYTKAQLAEKEKNDKIIRNGSLNELFWVKGYYGANSTYVPCRKINNVNILNQSTQETLDRMNLLTADSGKELAAIFWDSSTINFGRFPPENFLMPFKPEHDLCHTQKVKIARSRLDRTVRKGLPTMLEFFAGIYKNAVERDMAEKERISIERNASSNLTVVPRSPSLLNSANRLTCNIQEPNFVLLRVGDSVLLRDNAKRTIIKALISRVDPAKDFPLELDRLVDGTPYVQSCKLLERVIPPSEVKQALLKVPEKNIRFDPRIEYLSERRKVSDFKLVPGNDSELSHNDKLLAEAKKVSKEMNEPAKP